MSGLRSKSSARKSTDMCVLAKPLVAKPLVESRDVELFASR